MAEQEQEQRYEQGVWDNLILDWVEDPQRSVELSDGITVPVTPWDGSEHGKVTIGDILIHACVRVEEAPNRTEFVQAKFPGAAAHDGDPSTVDGQR